MNFNVFDFENLFYMFDDHHLGLFIKLIQYLLGIIDFR